MSTYFLNRNKQINAEALATQNSAFIKMEIPYNLKTTYFAIDYNNHLCVTINKRLMQYCIITIVHHAGKTVFSSLFECPNLALPCSLNAIVHRKLSLLLLLMKLLFFATVILYSLLFILYCFVSTL